MNPFIDPQQLQRERALFRYMLALEQGDDATIIAILRQAETDAILEEMIFSWHAEGDEGDDALAFAHDAGEVQHLAEKHLVTGASEEISDPPPLTVGDVIARLLEDLQSNQSSLRYAANIAQEGALLSANTTLLPEKLSVGALQQLFADQNIPVSSQFLKRFRDIAIYMAMGRERAINVAAARRQGTRKPKEPREPKA